MVVKVVQIRSRMLAAALCAIAVLASNSGAHAQESDAREPPPEALEFFDSGRAHYEAGRYEEAATDLERALALDPNSETLMFNLTRIYELLGQLDKAIEFGERYRSMVSYSEEEVARADATLRRLEGAREYLALRQSQQAPELRQLEPSVIVRERGVADSAFWIVLSSGAVMLLAGAGVGGSALGKQSQADDLIAGSAEDQAEREDLRSQADTMALTADILMITGAAAATAALLMYLLRVRSYEREGASALHISPTLTPTAAALTMEHSF